MKALFIVLLLVSFSQADEMKRIESIVEDITKLRVQYKECQNTLKSKETLKADIVKPNKNYSKSVQYQKQLKTEIDYLNKLSKKNKKIIQKYKKLLKIKENDILALKKSIKKQSKQALKKIDDNPFPKLMPKENEDLKEKVLITKASTYRLKSDSDIYDSPNGKRIKIWTENTSFTSNKKTINWVKITGFFVDKKWKKAKKDMWIKNSQIIKR